MKLTTLGFALLILVALAALARFAGSTSQAAPARTTPAIVQPTITNP